MRLYPFSYVRISRRNQNFITNIFTRRSGYDEKMRFNIIPWQTPFKKRTKKVLKCRNSLECLPHLWAVAWGSHLWAVAWGAPLYCCSVMLGLKGNPLTDRPHRIRVDTIYLQVNNYRLCHTRRINTEERAKVVAADWGTELMKFLAVLAILHQYDTLLEKHPNFRDITWNVEENLILHEIFRVISRFPRYISCYIAESQFSLGRCTKKRMNSSYSSYHPEAIHPTLYIILV